MIQSTLAALISWDRAFFIFLNTSFANRFADVFFITVTNAHFWIVPGILAAMLFVGFYKKKAAVLLLLVLLTVIITDQTAASLIKPAVGRLRPCNPEVLIEGGRFLLGHKTSFSFPSNHAANIFGAALMFSFFFPRSTLWFFLFACVIGFSRIYTGVHYPLDVLGGAILGGISASLVFGIHNWTVVYFKTRELKRLHPTR